MSFKKISKTKILPKLFVLAVIISLVGVLWPMMELKAYNPETSSNGDIRITVTEEAPSNLTQIGKSATNVNFLKIKIENLDASDNYLWSDLVVTYVGAASADIATDGVNLHLDNGDESFNASLDAIIFQRSLSAGQASFAMTGANVTINASSSKIYFVSLDTAAAPGNNNTVGVRISKEDMTLINQTDSSYVTDLPQAHRYGPTGAIDSVVPTITSAETGDRNNNGKIDYYKITFSENIDDSSINGYTDDNTAIATTVNHGFAVADYSTETIYLGTSAADAGLPADTNDDTVLYLGFAEGSADTDAKPQLTYTAGTGDLDDTASPANALADIADGDLIETDKAAPVLVSAASTNILQAGNIIAGKTVTLTFSESVTATSPTFTFDVKRNNTEGAQSYTNASFDGTTASISGGPGTTLTLTIVGATTGDNDTDFTMGEGQTQGYWDTNAKLKFTTVGAGTIKGTADDLDVNTSADYVSSISAEDGTKPDTVKVLGYDDGANGKLDKIEMYFNEALDTGTYTNADFTTLTAHNGVAAQNLTLTSAARDNTTDNLVVLTLDGTVSGTGAIVLKYDDDAGEAGTDIQDVSSNKYSVTVEQTPTTTDAVKPVLITAVTKDDDTVYVTFSENIENSANEITAALSSIKLADDTTAYEASSTDEANTLTTDGKGDLTSFYLHMTTATKAWNTDATGSSAGTGTDEGGTTRINVPAVRIDAAALKDTATSANTIAVANFTGTTDEASPVLITAKYLDNDDNGTVDNIELTFSETIVAHSAYYSDFAYVANDITNSVLTATGSAIPAPVGSKITLVLSTPGDSGKTSHSTAPTIAYTDDGSREISDADSNQVATFGATNIADGTAPVYKSSVTLDNDNNGTVDYIKITYSESVLDSTVAATDFEAGIAGYHSWQAN